MREFAPDTAPNPDIPPSPQPSGFPQRRRPGPTGHQAPGRTRMGVRMARTGSRGTRLLVVDDSSTIRRTAEIFLQPEGHTVILAEDGFDALGKIVTHEPDIIFVDILMPRLDGYQTCALI